MLMRYTWLMIQILLRHIGYAVTLATLLIRYDTLVIAGH